MCTQNKKITVKNLGLLAYSEACSLQESLFDHIITTKLNNRSLPSADQIPTPNYLLFCEHPHVYTLGRRGSAQHLLATQAILKSQGVNCYWTNRGGDITYHGPGQLVVYPVLDLENFFKDVHRYLRLLEEVVIATLKDYGLSGGMIPGLTGVWLNHQDQHRACKICALGIRTSRWVTMHGLALNINTALQYFTQIIPCGIPDKKVTSMAQALGEVQDVSAVAQTLTRHFVHLFGIEIYPTPLVAVPHRPPQTDPMSTMPGSSTTMHDAADVPANVALR